MMDWTFFGLSVGTLLVGGLAVAAVVGVVVLAYRAEQARVAHVQATYEGFGWLWDPEGRSARHMGLSSLSHFSQGGHTRFREGASGTIHGLTFTVFQHVYSQGSGKNRRTIRRVACAFDVPGLDLPAFHLRPEGLFQRLGAALGMQDIDFDEDERFSSAFRLSGPDEAAIRRAMTPDVRSVLVAHGSWTVQGEGSVIAVSPGIASWDSAMAESLRDEVLTLVLALVQGGSARV